MTSTLAPLASLLHPDSALRCSSSTDSGPNASLAHQVAVNKLHKAAGEFESLLLANLWKSMKATFAASDDDSTDPAHDVLENMGIDAMAGAVGKAGGLGLGALIVKHLQPEIANSQNDIGGAACKAFSRPADNHG